MASKDWKRDKRFSSRNPTWMNKKTREYIQVEWTLNLKKDKGMWRLIKQEGGRPPEKTIAWFENKDQAMKRAKSYMSNH